MTPLIFTIFICNFPLVQCFIGLSVVGAILSNKIVLIFLLFIFILLFKTTYFQKGALVSNDSVNNIEKMPFSELKDQNARRILTSFLKEKKYTPDQLLLAPLTKGRSGADLYKFSLGNHEYVLRMFSPINSYEDREREAYVSRIAGGHGIAPQVYYVDSKLEGMIIEFIPGRTILKKDLEHPEDIISFAQFLRKLHEIPMEKYEATSPLQRGDEWLSIAQKENKSFPSQFDTIAKKIDEVEEVLSNMPAQKVFIHNDLMPLNIMIDNSSYKLIDWPEAGSGHPFWDLTTFSDFNNLSDEEIKILLHEYLGRDATQKEMDLFTIMRPVSMFMRTIGGVAFDKEPRSTEFYDENLQESKLPSFRKMINDFSLGQLTLPLWQVMLICFKEAMRRVNEPKFDQALQRLQSSN